MIASVRAVVYTMLDINSRFCIVKPSHFHAIATCSSRGMGFMLDSALYTLGIATPIVIDTSNIAF